MQDYERWIAAKMVTYEDRPITERWAICENCGHSAIAGKYEAWWGKKCAVCGKEGCDECLDHNTFWADHKQIFHHKACKLTKELEALRYKYKMGITATCMSAIANYEPDHIC
jgi:hypothetical protein